MAKSKRNHKPTKRSRKKATASDEDSFFSRITDFGQSSSRIASAVVLGAMLMGWFLAEQPFVNRVAAMNTEPLTIRFTWPVMQPDINKPASQRRTWLHPEIQHELTQTASAALSMNPFDQLSLEAARASLLRTGWFAEIAEVRRRPMGVVDITCSWRAPAAIVSHRGTKYLVAAQGEVLRTPPGVDFGQQSLFRITNPSTGAPLDTDGRVAFGIPWQYGEVQPAIELLARIVELKHAKRVRSVDLTGFTQSGMLTLVTDTGCRIVWGAPPKEIVPHQASTEARLLRLEAILRDNLDRGVRELELFRLRGAFIDKTNDLR